MEINEIIIRTTETCQKWHDEGLRSFEWKDLNLEPPLSHSVKNLYHNYCIWHCIEDYGGEDREKVRFIYEGGAVHNKLRNHEAVSLDRYFTQYQSGGRLASEGVGAILDKINILTVKKMHLEDANDARLGMIEAHLANLVQCAHELVWDMRSGQRWYAIFDRFKVTGEDFE